MKKGKTAKINGLENVKCSYGTVDSKELKSIYVVLQTWVEPIKDVEKWVRVTGNLKRQIQHTLLEVVDNNIFEKNCIVDLDLRTSGIQLEKRSFMNLEITLFVKDKNMDFKSVLLKDKIKKILKSIYHDDLTTSEYFTLHTTKRLKV
jgi:hypothetical protein